MNFDGESVERVGVLRLRRPFAARSTHSAQDDKLQIFRQSLQLDRTT
jgi:hypothetical protein